MSDVARGHSGSNAFIRATRKIAEMSAGGSPFSMATVDETFGLILDSGLRLPPGYYMLSVPVNKDDVVLVVWLNKNQPIVTENFTTRTSGGNTNPLTGGAKAIDTASYCSPTWFADAYKDGVRLFIAQLFTHIDGDNPAAEPNLTYAREAGMAIAGYFTGTGNCAAALVAAGAANVAAMKFIAIDVEDGQIVVAGDITAIEAAVPEAYIYTSQGEWAASMGSSTAFSATKLWDARWDDKLSAEQWPKTVEPSGNEFVPYGGWTQRWGWQWRSPRLNGVDQYFHGVLVDYDTFGDPTVEGNEDAGLAVGQPVPHTLGYNHAVMPTGFATPALTLTTANAAGTAATAIRTDASLALFDATVPSTQAFGDAAAVGSAAFAARRDHKHAMMANPVSYATPAFTLTTANAAGAAATLVRSDASLALFDATAPTTITESAAAAAGSAAFAARRDHTHGTPATYTPTAHGASVHTDRTRYLWLPAGDFTIRLATPALTVQGTNARYSAWSFDAATAESIIMQIIAPADYVSGAVTLKFHWTNLGAGSGNVVWITGMGSVAAADNMNNEAPTTASQTIAAPAQDVLTVTTSTLSFTPTAGEVLMVRIQRDAANGADTLTNDAGVLGMSIEYGADM